MPKWDLREPSEKRLPPREKLPQLGEMTRRRGAPWPPWRRPGRGLSGLQLGPRVAAAARGAEAAAAVAGRARRPGPGAGRALYRGRRLRQEAGGGEGGATQLPGEGGGSAPGGHSAQPAVALTPACAPPASRPGLGLRSALAARRLPAQLPSVPSSRELRRPNLGKSFPTSDRLGGARQPHSFVS